MTHITVMTTAVSVAIAAPVASAKLLTLSPAIFIKPTMISLQIRAMMNPKAPAIASAIVDFTSVILTILSSTSCSHIKFLLFNFFCI